LSRRASSSTLDSVHILAKARGADFARWQAAFAQRAWAGVSAKMLAVVVVVAILGWHVANGTHATASVLGPVVQLGFLDSRSEV
jgi:hypothetical protein